MGNMTFIFVDILHAIGDGALKDEPQGYGYML
jgi:hypothetical protein